MTLDINNTKRFNDIIVGISFKVNCDYNTLNYLNRKSNNACFVDPGSAILCHALFQHIEAVLTSINKIKVGVSKVQSSYTNDIFTISWHVGPNGTSVCKTLKLVIKNLSPLKCKTGFTDISNRLKIESTEEYEKPDFDSSCEAFSGMENSLHCAVVGKTSKLLKEAKMNKKTGVTPLSTKQKILNILQNIDSGVSTKGKKYERKHSSKCPDNCQEIKAKGCDASIIHAYISSVTKYTPFFDKAKVSVPVPDKKWPKLLETLKKKVEGFFSPFDNVEDWKDYLKYILLDRNVIACSDLNDLNSYKVNDLRKLITSL